MEIEVDKWEPSTALNPETMGKNGNVLGKAKVVLGKKFFVWMTVFRGKYGKAFCKFPSFKIHKDEYEPLIGWMDGDKERAISDHVVNILKEKHVI